ncbi:MAG: hypothetical protein BroJett004_18010 [Planctomycetota bacterium]|nr:MAG: hypothetical protein BroJett004_18010 [Planctomycetota bacterium]
MLPMIGPRGGLGHSRGGILTGAARLLGFPAVDSSCPGWEALGAGALGNHAAEDAARPAR